MNKRKRQSIDPKRVSDYNKFLTTLDQTNKPTTENLVENNTLNMSTIRKINYEEEEMKQIIDKMIASLDIDFSNNNCGSINFTGQTVNDVNATNKPVEDPNYYKETQDYNQKMKKFLKNLNSHTQSSSDCCAKIHPTTNENIRKEYEKYKAKEHVVEIKETIHIQIEINDISDILKLIDTYKDDPSIKYNINMKALHNIKEPLTELNNMIGMKDLKNNIVDQILYFVQELHKDALSKGDFMHTVIYGPPGTGKTEIAQMMGKIYSKLGILTKGTFKKVTRSDLIAGYLGQTALKTRDVIKEAMGGVLFIDEAYALGNSEKRDSFAKECIDTLCEALSDHKDNLMVIIAGYQHELKECFFDYNQGLDSRFTWRFKTDEYDHNDLHQIFSKKVTDIGWQLDDKSQITSEWFKKNKDYLKFYGRDIETILAKTKIAHSRRIFCGPEDEKRKILLKDLENGFKIFLKNEDVKNRKNDFQFKKDMYHTLYS
uniref:AAA+ ATPase domain-containing protein n=1 Tax=viral metagenome TaxID=1070528 RepID=A0A6C0AQD4_9ZZZZ